MGQKWILVKNEAPPDDKLVYMRIQSSNSKNAFDVQARVIPGSTKEDLIQYGVIAWKDIEEKTDYDRSHQSVSDN